MDRADETSDAEGRVATNGAEARAATIGAEARAATNAVGHGTSGAVAASAHDSRASTVDDEAWGRFVLCLYMRGIFFSRFHRKLQKLLRKMIHCDSQTCDIRHR